MPSAIPIFVNDNAMTVPLRYRALFLSLQDHPPSLVTFSARGDEDAAMIAGMMTRGRAIDLWEDLRFIEHFPAEPGDL